jgi:hypothetical protein
MKFTEIADPDDSDAKLVIDCAHMIGPVRMLRARVHGGYKPGRRRSDSLAGSRDCGTRRITPPGTSVLNG